MMRPFLTGLTIAVFYMTGATGAFAQGAAPFAGFQHDASQPVEIAADSLTVDQTDGSAVFEGAVEVAQGTLRLRADRIAVFYAEGDGATNGQVTRMEAAGNVMLTTGDQAAESASATYDVAQGQVAMAGDVLLTQGGNALSGQGLDIDLNTGTARMTGRVKTILQPQNNP